MVDLAVQVGLGQRLADLGFGVGLWPAQPLVAAKAPVFSMSKLTQVDTYLGPEMKSTGEVMGLGDIGCRGAGQGAAGRRQRPARSGRGGAAVDRRARQGRGHAADSAPGASSATTWWRPKAPPRASATSSGCRSTAVTKKLTEGHPNVLDVIVSRPRFGGRQHRHRRSPAAARRLSDPPHRDRAAHAVLHQPGHAARRPGRLGFCA